MDPNEPTDELKDNEKAVQTSDNEGKEQLNLDDLDAAAGGFSGYVPEEFMDGLREWARRRREGQI